MGHRRASAIYHTQSQAQAQAQAPVQVQAQPGASPHGAGQADAYGSPRPSRLLSASQASLASAAAAAVAAASAAGTEPPTPGRHQHQQQQTWRPLHIALGPLSRESSRALLESLSSRQGTSWAPQAVEAVLDKSGGVPLYLVELCLHAGTPSQQTPGGIPDTVGQIVLSRVDRLSPSAQAAARLASVIGAEFTPAAVAAADPSGMGDAAVASALRELYTAGLIREKAGGRAGGEAFVAFEEAAWPPPSARFCWHHALVQASPLKASKVLLSKGFRRRKASKVLLSKGAP
eukprot:tig00020693_g13020.t1